jgi:hypothetical protein
LIRILRKSAIILLFLLLGLGLLLLLVAKSYTVQTYVAQRLAAKISTDIGAEVSIDRLEFDPINSLLLHGLLVRDEKGDTLMAAEQVVLGINRLVIRGNRFIFSELSLQKADFRLKQIDSTGSTNLDFITAYFSGSEQDTLAQERKPLFLSISGFNLIGCEFSYNNPFAPIPAFTNGLNINDLKISDIHGRFEDFRLEGDTMHFHARSFAFQERSGFELQQLIGAVEIHGQGITFTDLVLETGQSKLSGMLALEHEQWSDYNSFTSSIVWNTDFKDSKIHFADIGYFAEPLYDMDLSLFLSGKVTGTMANLKGREIFIIAGERTIFRGDLDMKGLPDFENTFIDLRLSQLSSDFYDLEKLKVKARPNDKVVGLPDELARAGAMFFKGSFTGFPADFVAYGELTTEVGKLNLDLNVQDGEDKLHLYYRGSAATTGLDIGHLLNIPGLGSVAASVDIEAKSGAIIEQVKINGNIDALMFKDYAYTSIEVDGEVTKQRFSGELKCFDPNLDFSFNGLVDFDSALPIFNFRANVNNLDLTALKLVDFPKPFSFATSMVMNGQGSTPADFSGSFSARNSFLCYGDTAIFLKNLVLSSFGDSQSRKTTLSSDIVDAGITGKYELDELYSGLHQMVAVVLPTLRLQEDLNFVSHQVYDFSLNYKAPYVLAGLLIPGLDIAPGTTLYGTFDNQSGRIDVLLRSGSLGYGGVTLKDIVLNATKQSETAVLSLRADNAEVVGTQLENLDLSLNAFNDLVEIDFEWFNSDLSSAGIFAGAATFYDKQSMSFNIDTLRLTASNTTWRMMSPAQLDLDTSGLYFDEIEFAHMQQRILAAGKVSKSLEDEMVLSLKDIDLASLDSLGVSTDLHLAGIVNADVSVKGLLGVPVVTAQLGVAGFAIDSIAIGNVSAFSKYNRENNSLELEGTLDRSDYKVLDFKGSYALDQAEDPLNGEIFLESFDIALVNIFDLGVVDQFSGEANGTIRVNGTLGAPKLQGHIDFDKARFRVDYLNTFFEFSDRLRVEEDYFGIDYKPLTDQEGSTGFVVASAFHENFRKWSYDISAEVEQFTVLNTNRSMNEIFYGTARATGFLQIGGYEDFLEISIDAKTGRGTSIKLPLDEPSDLDLENFVRFVGRNEDATELERTNLEGVSMRLNIEATPEAEIQLIFDERAGDIIKGRGRGIVTLEIAPDGEFQMFGQYEIVEGSYLFTLKNLINKQFQVKPGGTVSWYGDPYQADLNIDAVYSLRTQLFPIMLENRERYRTREDVNVVLNLTDKLLNPNIAFDIELPQSTDLERSQLASVVSTTQQLNQQVFALLILNRFLPAVDEEQAGFGGLGSATTSDFVSTQISNWLSEISNDFEIGLNYRPGDEISNQEIAVALSTQLFNERVLVSGQFGMTAPNEAQQTVGQNGLVGDFLLEYLITQDGTVRLKVFNETNPYDVFVSAGSIYTQGIGLVFTEEFDTFDQFFEKIAELFSKDVAKSAE